jgi:hypothetical protein
VPEYRSGKSYRAVFRENGEQDAGLLTAALRQQRWQRAKIDGMGFVRGRESSENSRRNQFGARVIRKTDNGTCSSVR